MGNIHYDDGAANRLATAATTAADRLRGQAGSRRSAAETARDDFDGAYAKRFDEGATIESEDRSKLATVLDDLADQVDKATEAADRERKRQADLAAWQERKAAREAAEASSPLGIFGASGVPPLDVGPSDRPETPPSVSASFSPRSRTRTGGGTADGKSSADPAALRTWASTARGLDLAAGSERTSVANAWLAFTASCSWARISTSTFIGGFDRLLDENREDAAWIDRVADAFDRAGGQGSLSNAVLDVSAAAELPPGMSSLFDAGLTPAQVAARWKALGLSDSDANDLKALPLPVLERLGNLEGVAYWARDTANRVVLTDRIRLAQEAIDAYGRSTTYDPSNSRFGTLYQHLRALEDIRTAAEEDTNAGQRFLISLDDTVQPPLAAVSIGDLDHASNVTWAVPGMGTDTTGMTDWTDAAQNIYDQQRFSGPSDRAVVSWVGYATPPQPVISGKLDVGVLGSDYATAGADKLAAALRGLDATRSGDDFSDNIVAHSYGSTTAGYALTKSGVHVDSLTTVGSAGLPTTVEHASDLHADHVYAGQAQNIWAWEPGRGDRWAQVGRTGPTHSQNPIDPDFGSTPFGTDGVPGTTNMHSTDDHAVHTDDLRGYLDPNTESLRNVGLASTGHPEDMTEHVPKGPTDFERQMQTLP